tara:strand:+ start:59 stop:502 length:444 start_codon:yes stop_codon:yes gene_type:complete
MINDKLIKLGFKILCVIGISIILCGSVVNAQDKSKPKVVSITDDNFKKKIAKGFVLVHFTAKYQMATLDKKLFDGVTKFEGCVIHEIDHSNVKKVAKKLRLRNYPSLALFHNGKKINVWKGDMDGVVDVTNKHIKKAISDALAGDVF